MNRAEFYKSLRRRNSGVFGTSLSQKQVEGVEAILNECAFNGCDVGQTAYILGTAYGETGGKMQPRYENMNYSAGRIPEVFSRARRQGLSAAQLARNPKKLANTVYGGEWGRENLGNTELGDGWRFRGTGLPQVTGRRNFIKWGNKLGLDLVNEPELLMRLDISVKGLVRPMMEGWATGLALPAFVEGKMRDYEGARRVWNGMFEAEKYARYAKGFEAALEAGGWADRRPVLPPDVEPIPTKPAEQPTGWLTALIQALFRRK